MKELDFDNIFKNIVEDMDFEICFIDLNHTIRYMNKNAIERYKHRGGNKLIGNSLFNCHNEDSKAKIEIYVEKLKSDKTIKGINMGYNPKHDETNYIIPVRDDNDELVGYYEKHVKGIVTE